MPKCDFNKAGGPCHIDGVKIGFYMIWTFVMKEQVRDVISALQISMVVLLTKVVSNINLKT